jgi:branched-chain amino acid transport system ATP-binding protein
VAEALLSLRGVDAFYGGAHILHAVSLEVAAGEVLALVGRNGAGKSTVMRAIMGFLRPRRGSVRFAGAEIAGWEPYRVARLGVGWVPEDRRVFPGLSVAENLAVGARQARPGSAAWSAERLYALFPNLAERRGLAAGRLSGGEQQMLSIARTLMGNPRLVLLDEPSEGLAPLVANDVAAAVAAMKGEGLAVLLSEQNLPFARSVADRAAVLERGVVRFTGGFAALATAPAALAALAV